MSDSLNAVVPGADKVEALYGRWPSFHDAEVVELRLRRAGGSTIKVHVFAMTDRVSETGHFVTENHAIVTFALEGISDCELYGFNQQNVISALMIQAGESGYELTLGGCYGLEGKVVASKLSIEIELGVPPDSIYAAHPADTEVQ